MVHSPHAWRMSMDAFQLTPEQHHQLAIRLNGLVWSLLDNTARSSEEDALLESAALGAMHHWHHSPHFAPINVQRGHWMLSRVYAVLGRADEAQAHATLCATWTMKSDAKDFDQAYALEARARACAARGDTDHAQTLRDEALTAGRAIVGDTDRKYFLQDLQAAPWFDLPPLDVNDA